MMFCSRHGHQNCIVCFDRMAGIPRHIPIRRPVAHKELICGTIVVIALAVIAVCLAGCTPIVLKDVDLSKLQREHLLVADVRPCDGMYFCYPWIAPHKLDLYRNAAGDMQVMPEASNGQGLDALTSPVETAVGHFSWGMP